jgi:curli production assembly/transport component CsgE
MYRGNFSRTHAAHVMLSVAAIAFSGALHASSTTVEDSVEAQAAPSKDAPLSAYGGIVADQTVTVAGQDFYRQFVTQWHDRDNTDHYELVVVERPSPRWGTLISVMYKQRQIFRMQLPPSRAAIPQLGAQAVDVVYQAVVDSDVAQRLFKDTDLGRDEI